MEVATARAVRLAKPQLQQQLTWLTLAVYSLSTEERLSAPSEELLVPFDEIWRRRLPRVDLAIPASPEPGTAYTVRVAKPQLQQQSLRLTIAMRSPTMRMAFECTACKADMRLYVMIAREGSATYT